MNNIKIHSESHNYNVIVYDNIVKLIEKYIPKDKKIVLIYDSFFNGSTILDTFKNTNSNILFISIAGGEDAKTPKVYEQVISQMIDNNVSKKDLLIALGGGTITDLSGFIAATYKRGLDYITFPTTTLAMIDASIGGKTAINNNNIKNVLGVIYPPKMVLIGTDVLNTLDERNYQNGLVEALKMGLIFDKKIFEMFLNMSEIKTNIIELIIESIKAKAYIVQKDEKDIGLRRILNFGHTVGHAIEIVSNDLLHGEAVANGMLFMSKNESYFNELKNILQEMNVPLIKNFDFDLLYKQIYNDKKANDKNISLIKVHKIGKAVIEDTNIDVLKGELKNYVL